MIKKIFVGLGMIILVGFGILIFKEFNYQKPIPDIIELPSGYRTDDSIPVAIEKQQEITPTDATTIANTRANKQSVSLLIDSVLGFAEIEYPNLYAFDYKEKSIKIFDLKNRTYKELYSNPDINFVSFSPRKNNIIFKKSVKGFSQFYLLNLIKDKIYPLEIFIKNISWINDTEFLYYFSNNSSVNYIGKAVISSSGLKNEKLVDIGTINPQFNFANNNLLISSEKQSPLFLISLKTKSRKIVFDEMPYISFLTDGNLIFVNYAKQSLSSAIIDGTGKILKKFDWGTFKEKCYLSNTTLGQTQIKLICGVPTGDQSAGSYLDWKELRSSTSDKLVIVDIKTFDIKEIKIEGDFDILNPRLTPIGIIFTNRLDSKLYLAPVE
ncbi:MAG: hypothetical protein AAB371_02525 [Patescibacteria group bacterium]